MRRRTRIFLGSLIATFAILRLWLHHSPDSDFFLFGYNIHHLFTGILIVSVCVIPLVLGSRATKLHDFFVAGFGIGLTFVLDEVVYLITTDGSNASYLLPRSLWGGTVAVGLAALYATAVDVWACRDAKATGAAAID
jgi:hypothetical protein